MGTPAGQETVPEGVTVPVPFVPAGVKFTAPFVPAGVPALTREDETESPVNVEVELTPAGVKDTVEFVPDGVMEFDPPVVPTSEFPATVPTMNLPDITETSVNPEGQAPPVEITIRPDGNGAASASVTKTPIMGPFLFMFPPHDMKGENTPRNKRDRISRRITGAGPFHTR